MLGNKYSWYKQDYLYKPAEHRWTVQLSRLALTEHPIIGASRVARSIGADVSAGNIVARPPRFLPGILWCNLLKRIFAHEHD